MPQQGLSEGMGTASRPIRWERLFLFFGALVCADLVWLILAPSASHSSTEGFSFRMFQIPPPAIWADFLLGDLLQAALTFIAFRLLSNALIAIPVAVLSYVPLHSLFQLLFRGFDFWRLIFLTASTLAFLVGLDLMLRLTRQWWFAFFVGAVAGSIAPRVVWLALRGSLTDMKSDLVFDLMFMPFWLLSAGIFAGVFWLGIWLTTPRAGAAEPRLSKGFYLSALAVTQGITILLAAAMGIMLVAEVRKLSASAAVGLLLIAGVLMLLGIVEIVVLSVLIYRMWAAIQDGHARSSPGQAVGLLFVPFFNLYWVFQAFWGFAKDYNSFLARYALDIRRLPEGLFLAYVILGFVWWVPLVGWAAIAAQVVIGLVMVARICDAVNALPIAQPATRVEQAGG